jgi:acetyl esterase
MSSAEYFAFDPDWEKYASENGFPIPSNNIPPPCPIVPAKIDFSAARPYQAEVDAAWAAAHPLSSVGYSSRLMTIKVRNGESISVKVSYPVASRLQAKGELVLPVLFVTHGGGWVSGSHISEEAWLLWPLYKHFNLVIVSVEYRLAPENKFPVWINDSWDVLYQLISESSSFVSDLDVKCDLQRVILAGSSAGASIAAALSQMCRDKRVKIYGVVLNVPVLCDYRQMLSEENAANSYTECTETFLGSREMAALWNMVLPLPSLGSDSMASPLLGNTENLPPHLIFVAGRDPLRDEGIAYAKKLEAAGVPVTLEIYKGVPHNFAHYSDLKSTTKFREDFRIGLQQWVPSVYSGI